jgi:hypothetical protein
MESCAHDAVIPPSLQVGKILEYFSGEINASLSFIDAQIYLDNQAAAFHDKYWPAVRERFNQLLQRGLNELITEE